MRSIFGKWVRRACFGLAAALCVSVCAQEYPARPVKIIINVSPGGMPDVTVRVLANQFSVQFG